MRVVVVGAGIIGCAIAEALTRADANVEVVVLDRGGVGAGTTSRGEGNILLSDKSPGPELDLALASHGLWLELADRLGAERIELEEKGGLVVALGDASVDPLHRLAAAQRATGVRAVVIERPHDLEPHLSTRVRTAVHYPEDMQVQPVLAAAAMLAAARARGADVRFGVQVTGPVTDDAGRLVGVATSAGEVRADAVVNAAGTWGGHVAALLGCPVPVLPRRGFVLVTEPLPLLVHHKVYTADYVDNVGSSDEGLQTSTVIEGTRGGTVLIGASRERVGFDATMNPAVVKLLARQAVSVFPFLAEVNLLRVYRGFRPYCPDHLPVIGPDPRMRQLVHACGHEGAGIGLAPATGALVADHLLGSAGGLLADQFASLRPDRLLDTVEARVEETL